MIRNIQANFWESLVALLILALSSWQTIKAFTYLYPQASLGKSTQFTPTKIDKSFIFNKKSSDIPLCLGYLVSKFDRTLETTTYSLKGELFLGIQNRNIPTKLDLEASFNILGQHAASVLKLSSLESSLTLGLLNVDPIEITLLSSKDSKQNIKKKKFSIPGPIILNDLGANFQLDYPAANQSLLLSLESKPIDQLFDVVVSQQINAESICLSQASGTIDLSQALTRVQDKYSSILSLLPLGLLPHSPPIFNGN